MQAHTSAEERVEVSATKLPFDWESKQNLVGFFLLLQKVDRRINPHLYQTTETADSVSVFGGVSESPRN